MRVAEAPVGALGVDTIQRLTRAAALQPGELGAASQLAAAGIRFAVRYLPDLTAEEIADILGAGLALMLVAHVRYPGWHPSAQVGAADAERVGQRARDLDIPSDATIWCDLEGMGGAAEDAISYANAWANGVRSFHFEPGVYVGAGVPLDGDALYHRLTVSHYWRSMSAVPDVSRRGYQMLQLNPQTKIAGVTVDLDVTQQDHYGQMPSWIVKD